MIEAYEIVAGLLLVALFGMLIWDDLTRPHD